LTTVSKVSWVITLTMANLNSYRFINFGKLINCRSIRTFYFCWEQNKA
jgi:hypothetical protein